MNHKLNHKSDLKIRIRRQHHKILRIKVVFKSEAGFPWISELWRWICHECLHVRKKTRKTTQIFPFSFIVTYRGRAQEFRPQWLFVKVYYVCFQHSAWIWFFSFWCEVFSCNQKYPPLVQAKQRINRSYALIYITMLGRASGFLGLIRPHFLRHKQWPQRRRAATSLWPRREKGAGVLSKVLYGGPISYFFVKKEPPSKKKKFGLSS